MNNFDCFTHNGVSLSLNDSAYYHYYNCYELNTHNQVQFIRSSVRSLLSINDNVVIDSKLIKSLNLKGKYRDLQHYSKVLGIPATLPAKDLSFILLSID